MKIAIKTQNCELSDSLSSYVDKKAAAFEKFTGASDTVLCEVELRKDAAKQSGPIFYAEINLTDEGKLYRASTTEESFEAALDVVKDEILRELRKEKRKRMFSLRDGGKRVKDWLRGFSR